jgi:chromosome partitioning protein
MPVLTFLNQKGGVGKTSTCYHLAGTLAAMRRKVLLIDTDPQASLTQGFLDAELRRRLDPDETVVAIYRGSDPLPGRVTRCVRPGIDLVPAARSLERYNVPEPHLADREAQAYLRDFLGEVKGDYDLVLIDCQPTLQFCTWGAMVAADALVMPLAPESFSTEGIADVQESIALVRAGMNPGLALAGYLITRVLKNTVHQFVERKLRDAYGAAVFAATVPNLVHYNEAVLHGEPIAAYKPRSVAAKAMKALAEELEVRLSGRKEAA